MAASVTKNKPSVLQGFLPARVLLFFRFGFSPRLSTPKFCRVASTFPPWPEKSTCASASAQVHSSINPIAGPAGSIFAGGKTVELGRRPGFAKPSSGLFAGRGGFGQCWLADGLAERIFQASSFRGASNGRLTKAGPVLSGRGPFLDHTIPASMCPAPGKSTPITNHASNQKGLIPFCLFYVRTGPAPRGWVVGCGPETANPEMVGLPSANDSGIFGFRIGPKYLVSRAGGFAPDRAQGRSGGFGRPGPFEFLPAAFAGLIGRGPSSAIFPYFPGKVPQALTTNNSIWAGRTIIIGFSDRFLLRCGHQQPAWSGPKSSI